MNIKECYNYIGADYEDVLKRMMKEERVTKFAKMFLKDPSYEGLVKAMEEEDYDEAFRMAHTLKGVCQNLAFEALGAPSVAITEMLRMPDRDIEMAKSLLPDVTEQYQRTVEGLKMVD